MTTKDYSQLGAVTTINNTDLIAVWPSGGPLKAITALNARTNYFNAASLPLAGGTMTGALLAYAGTEGLPGLSFASDADTGLYRIGANNIGVSCAGVKVLDISTAGMTVVGTLTATLTGNVTGNVTGNLTGNVTGNADTATSAAKWTTARALSFTGDATGSGSVDGSAAVATALTLATVNSNTGSFGSASVVPVITVNGKGLITAVTTASISSTAITTFPPHGPSSTTYTLILTDAGKNVTVDGAAANLVIPANASVAFDIGTCIIFARAAATSMTLSITSDTLLWYEANGSVGTGTRTIAGYGMGMLLKISNTTWVLYFGQGIT